MKDETSVISNETIAGKDSTDGAAGSSLKSVGTLILFVEIAYSAPEGRKTPRSSALDGAIKWLLAPSTETISYTALLLGKSPSTS